MAARGFHTHYPPDSGITIDHDGPPESCDDMALGPLSAERARLVAEAGRITEDDNPLGWGERVVSKRYTEAEVHVIDAPSRLGVNECNVRSEHVHIEVDDDRFAVYVVNAFAGSRLSLKAEGGEVLVQEVPFEPSWWQRFRGLTLDNVVSLAVKWARRARWERFGMYDARADAERRYGVRRSR